jgi:tetratricopeptide (TPR) repeat protein
LLDDLGDLEGTVATFEILCRLNPEEGDMFAAAGAKLAALQRHGAAVTTLRRALELGVDDFGLRSTLAASLYALKRWDEAREIFEGLLEEHPEDADTWVRYATVCTRCNRLQEAERALDRGAQLGAADEAVAAVREKIRLIRLRREQTGPGE